MTIQYKKIAFDTNIWIFGLRQHYEYPSCFALLKLLDMINIVIPRQILKELQVNLTESEFREFFHTLSRLQSNVIISWEKASEENIIKYQNLGCKLGDAAVASNLEELGVEILISENRHFLKEIKSLPFRCINSTDALSELGDDL